MGSDTTQGQREKIFSFFNTGFNILVNESGIKSYDQLLLLWLDFREIYLDAADSVLQRYSEIFDDVGKTGVMEKITACSVIVEVVDQVTGKLFRRNLPLSYLETDNGIILSGENSEGKPSDIAFLSDTAIERITELTGKGPDTPRCGH